MKKILLFILYCFITRIVFSQQLPENILLQDIDYETCNRKYPQNRLIPRFFTTKVWKLTSTFKILIHCASLKERVLCPRSFFSCYFILTLSE
jgi:hypothetical protein